MSDQSNTGATPRRGLQFWPRRLLRLPSLKNAKIGRKLALALGGVVVVLAAMALLALWGIRTNSRLTVDSLDRMSKCLLAEKVASGTSAMEDHIGRMLLAQMVSDDTKGELAEIQKNYDAALTDFKATANTPKSIKHGNDLTELLQALSASNAEVIGSMERGKFAEAKQQFAGSQQVGADVRAKGEQAERWQEQLLAVNEAERAKTTKTVVLALLAGSLFSVILATLAGFLLTRGISKPLGNAVEHLELVAAGDVSRDLPAAYLERGDEIGLLAKSMQAMSASLRTMVQDVSGGIQVLSASSANLTSSSVHLTSGSHDASEKAHSVASAAGEMSSNMTSVAAGMEQTSANLMEVTTATEQMTSTIGEIAEKAEQARNVTGDAARQATQIAIQMGQLGEAAREIGNVTGTISEISSQTNLLALNATIEAARAGTAGKGFAVVANEIKELAQQAAQASDDIKTRITGVQSATAEGISEMAKVSHVIQSVSEIVASIAAAIEQQSTTTKNIARNIAEASMGVSQANVSVSETSRTSQEIAHEISGMDHAVGEMAGGSELVRSSAVELSGVAEQLSLAVARFRT